MLELPYGEDEQEKEDDDRLLEQGAEDEAAELLDDTHAEARRDHARHIAEARRRDDHERADRVGDAVERLDDPDHHDQRPRRTADRGVQGEGEGVDLVGVDAEHTRGARILRRRADRLSHARVLHEEDDRDRECRRHGEADEAHDADADQAIEKLDVAESGVGCLRLRTEDRGSCPAA